MQKEVPSIYAAIDIGSNTIHLKACIPKGA
jgi:exopolyphosphatase/pppGpp-phosphohydrolase